MTANVYELILIIEDIIVAIQQLVDFFMTATGPGEFFPLIHEIFSGAHQFFRFAISIFDANLRLAFFPSRVKNKKNILNFRKSVLSMIDLQVLAVENNKNFREYGKNRLKIKINNRNLRPLRNRMQAFCSISQ